MVRPFIRNVCAIQRRTQGRNPFIFYERERSVLVSTQKREVSIEARPIKCDTFVVKLGGRIYTYTFYSWI